MQIGRGQVIVPVLDPGSGRRGHADVLDLDDDSFRRWVVSVLVRHGLLAAPPPMPDDEPVRPEELELFVRRGAEIR